MNKTYLFAAALTAALFAGCSSTPKTDPAIAGEGGVGAGGAASDVAQVQAGDGSGYGLDAQGGPAGVGRVVYFDFDSYTVRADARPIVDGNARHLQANPGRSVMLEGHTDVRGSREYNLALGQKRAEAVRRAMMQMGAADAQLEAVSFGEEKPAAWGSSENDHAQNRRVEIRYR